MPFRQAERVIYVFFSLTPTAHGGVLRHVSQTQITDETLEQRLAKRVRELRNKLGLTLKVASERAEIHWRFWQKIEAAQVHVTLQTVARLGRVLGVDGGDLLSA